MRGRQEQACLRLLERSIQEMLGSDVQKLQQSGNLALLVT